MDKITAQRDTYCQACLSKETTAEVWLEKVYLVLEDDEEVLSDCLVDLCETCLGEMLGIVRRDKRQQELVEVVKARSAEHKEGENSCREQV